MKNSFLILLVIVLAIYYVLKLKEWFIYQTFGKWKVKHDDKTYEGKKVNYTKDGKQSFFGIYGVFYYLEQDTWKIVPSKQYNNFSFIDKYNIPKEFKGG
ncbi:MAG: hypothetical protein IE890_04235 [Arcobacter sp.]|nr:hypothetical protein [Arcobacter sp.]